MQTLRHPDQKRVFCHPASKSEISLWQKLGLAFIYSPKNQSEKIQLVIPKHGIMTVITNGGKEPLVCLMPAVHHENMNTTVLYQKPNIDNINAYTKAMIGNHVPLPKALQDKRLVPTTTPKTTQQKSDNKENIEGNVETEQPRKINEMEAEIP